jgi:hypothetical protein
MNARQGPIHRFESLKRRLYNRNASIYFNRQCLKRKLTPTYAKIKVPNTSPAHKHTQHKVTYIRIKDDIKYLHAKNQKLNALIYQLHLDLTNTWKNLWPLIHHTTEDTLQRKPRSRYLNLDRKLNHLAQIQTKASYKTKLLPQNHKQHRHSIFRTRKDQNTIYTTSRKAGYRI